jgi:alpha,alpha-trehalase
MQPASVLGNNSAVFEKSISNIQQGKPWPLAIAIEFANRYLQVALCSWYSTGGSIPGLLDQLSAQELNITGNAVPGGTGNIFEKFNLTDVDAAGGGGE